MDWKKIPFAPEYEVSEFGDVRRASASPLKRGGHAKIGKVLSTKGRGVYPAVSLRIDGKTITMRNHTIVAKVFLETPSSETTDVAHLDGSTHNNHYSNLKWVTRKENMRQAIEDHGTFQMKEKHYRARFSEEDVKEMGESKETNKVLAYKFNTSYKTIWAIKTGKDRKHG
jgi:hypothetical protein